MVSIEAMSRSPWILERPKHSIRRQEPTAHPSPEPELRHTHLDHLSEALLLNYLQNKGVSEFAVQREQYERRELNKLRPFKRAKLRLSIIENFEQEARAGSVYISRVKGLTEQARNDFQKASKYTSIKPEEKKEYYRMLVDTIRLDPTMTWGESTKWLMSQRGVGLEATMAILEDFSRYSWEGKDISYDRRKRLAEKKMEAKKEKEAKAKGQPAPTQKDWTDEDRRIVEENANITGPSFGFNAVLADFERNKYQELASLLSPASIAQMIDPYLTDREFRLSYKYKDVCEMLKNMLAGTGNPY